MYDPPSQTPYKTIWKPKKNLKIFVLGHEKRPKISKKFDTYSYVNCMYQVLHTYALHVCCCPYLNCMYHVLHIFGTPCSISVCCRTHQGGEGLPGGANYSEKIDFFRLRRRGSGQGKENIYFGEEARVKERRKTKRRKGSSCQQPVCIGKVARDKAVNDHLFYLSRNSNFKIQQKFY